MPIGRRRFIERSILGVSALASAEQAATANPDSGQIDESFTFAVVADPHLSEPAKPGIEHCGNAVEKFQLCLQAIKNLEGADRPDFMLIVGDVHPHVLVDHLESVDIPIHAIAGNHESTKEKRKQLRDLFPEDFTRDGKESDYYSFVHKGVRFVGICNAGMGGEHVGQFCSEIIEPRGQCEWLEAELAQAEPRKIVFGHVPPERAGADKNMYMARNDSRWFNELTRRTEPEAMFFGHLHLDTEEYLIGKTRCLNLRSCCWNFGKKPLGFALARVTAEGIGIREILTGAYT